ncbi:MAG: hypothetical protein E7363_06290 [Clostridiales bacterium]|nr:hypothetical protein [Clostridiales bacterium]
MKKRLLALFLVLSLAMGTLFTLTGCALISKDEERDLNQVVATVKVNDRTDNITKRELISSFNQYGYTYMYYYGMSAEATLDLLLDQLVNRKIVVQKAETILPEMNAGTIIGNPLEKYLSQNQINTIKKKANETINSAIEGYLEKDEEEETEDTEETEEIRTTPTYEDDGEEEVVLESEIPEVDKDSTKAIKTAYAQFEKDLKKNYYTYETYYASVVEGMIEDEIVGLWEDSVEAGVEITFAEMEARYADLKDVQDTLYTKPSDYNTALGQVSSSKFVVSNEAVGYGYVYNLLIPFSDYQAAILAKYTAKYQAGKMSTAEYKTIRASLLTQVKAKDLRESWISAGYDYDFTTQLFGEDYCKTEGIPFDGTVSYTYTNEDGEEVVLVNTEAPENTKGKYSFVTNEHSMSEFLADFDDWMNATDIPLGPDAPYLKAGQVDFDVMTSTAAKEMIFDLCFAYGSDNGILNSYKGYVSAPAPADNGTETYVKEFAEAARDVVAAGAGTYVVVGTDYGWHIVYCTESLNVNSSTLREADLTVPGTFTYNFHKVMFDSLSKKTISETQTEMLNTYNKNENVVKKYASRYADLLG